MKKKNKIKTLFNNAKTKTKKFVDDHKEGLVMGTLTVLGTTSLILVGRSIGKLESEAYYMPKLKQKFDDGVKVGNYAVSAAFMADHERAEAIEMSKTRVFDDETLEEITDYEQKKAYIVEDGLKILEQNEKS